MYIKSCCAAFADIEAPKYLHKKCGSNYPSVPAPRSVSNPNESSASALHPPLPKGTPLHSAAVFFLSNPTFFVKPVLLLVDSFYQLRAKYLATGAVTPCTDIYDTFLNMCVYVKLKKYETYIIYGCISICVYIYMYIKYISILM